MDNLNYGLYEWMGTALFVLFSGYVVIYGIFCTALSCTKSYPRIPVIVFWSWLIAIAGMSLWGDFIVAIEWNMYTSPVIAMVLLYSTIQQRRINEQLHYKTN